MIFPRYQKFLTVLIFVFALSFVFYTGTVSADVASCKADCPGLAQLNCPPLPGGLPDQICYDRFLNSCIQQCTQGSQGTVRYSCRASDGACINDPNGGYTTSNCDNACSSAGGGKTTGTDAKGNNSDLPGIDLTIQGVFNIIYGFACWLWSIAMLLLVIFIIISGIRFMYAGDDQTKITNAKTNFKYVILGAIVVMGTFVIISTVAYNIGADISFIPFDCTGGSTVTDVTHYSCNAADGACVEDPEGGYTNSDCDNACSSAGGGPAGSRVCTVDSDCPNGQFCSGDAPRGEPQGNGVCAPATGNAITHLGCVNNACRQINGAGVDDCSACSGTGGVKYYSCDSTQNACIEDPAGEYSNLSACDNACGGGSTPTPIDASHLECGTLVGAGGFRRCVRIDGIGGPNLDGCGRAGDSCVPAQ